MGQHTAAWLARHLKQVLDRFELSDSHLMAITINNSSRNYLMIRQQQTSLEASGTKSPVLRNHVPCIVHIIQPALGAFMISLGVKRRIKSWEARELEQQFGETETAEIGNSQRLRKAGKARMHKVLAMRPGLAKIIEKVHIST